MQASERSAKRVAIYARVSTTDQTTENQLLDLRRHCSSRGWAIFDIFTDTGISGKKADRPALRRLMDSVRKRQVDGVLVWRFDRFARSVSHLVAALEEFRRLGVSFTSYQEGIDTTTPQGEFFFHIVAAMAQFERSIIVERINAGLRRARDEGKRLGRPIHITDDCIKRIFALHAEGRKLRAIAAELGISKSAVHLILSKKPSQNVASSVVGDHVAF